MKYLVEILLIILATLFLTSCQKVIDLELNDADKKLVIEAVLTDQSGGCVVSISKTANVSAANDFEKVSGARVTISDDNGTAVNLIETQPGEYRSELTGVPGHWYGLEVKLGQHSFEAASLMPQPVTIDSVYTTVMDMMGEKSYVTHAVFTDPVAKGNAYRLVQYRNGVKDPMFMVLNDNVSNGKQNTVSFYHNDDQSVKGDRITVQLESIDQPVYKYWYSLWQGSTGQGNTASPGNPATNLSGGVLGYFSAHTVTTFESVIR